MSTSPDLPPVNTAPSSLNGARQLALHLGWLVLFGGFAWALPAPWSLVPWLVYGVGLVTLFAPLHESSHNSVFAHDWANRALASVLGLILFLPALEFRYFHFAHHRFTQIPEFRRVETGCTHDVDCGETDHQHVMRGIDIVFCSIQQARVIVDEVGIPHGAEKL